MAPEAEHTALPRPLLVVGVPVLGIFLVLLFIYLGFPYEKLGDRIIAELQRSHAVQIDFQTLGPRLHLTGPGIEATGVRVTLRSRETVRIEHATLRPAWSWAWFRGALAVYAEIESSVGGAAGTLVLGASGGWSGDLEQVAVGKLPLSQFAPAGTLDGVLDASVDIRLREEGPEGRVTFEARDGSIGLPNFPIAIPFEKLSGDLIFGDEAYVAIERLDLEGPLLSAGVTGNVLHAATFSAAPLRLEAEIAASPSAQGPIQKAGMRMDRDGKAKFRITGTIGQPNVR